MQLKPKFLVLALKYIHYLKAEKYYKVHMSTGADVTSTWNSLFISSEIPHPNLPSGYTKTSWGVTLSNSNNLMWCSISGASVFRLIAGASTSAATRTVIVTVYASK